MTETGHTCPEAGSSVSTSRNTVEPPPRLWGWQTFLSGLAAIAFIGVLSTFVDWAAVWREFLESNKGYILLGAACHYLTYPVRGLRWRHSLTQLPFTGGRRRFGLVVFFYNFIDNIVPAKMGDLYAAHMARINFGVRRSAAIGAIALLRMIDAWIILVLSFLASWTLLSGRFPDSVIWALASGVVIALAASAILLAILYLNRALPAWIPEKIRPMVQAFGRGMWPRSSERIPIIGLTVAIWALETLWIFFLSLGFGIRLAPSEVLFLTMIPLLASAFPFTPSGAGVVEVTLYNCLRLVGVASPLAGSITVLNRFLDYWLHILLGVVVWSIRRRLGLRTWRERPKADREGPAPDGPCLDENAGVS